MLFYFDALQTDLSLMSQCVQLNVGGKRGSECSTGSALLVP